jgi:hypothetical protein
MSVEIFIIRRRDKSICTKLSDIGAEAFGMDADRYQGRTGVLLVRSLGHRGPPKLGPQHVATADGSFQNPERAVGRLI